MGVLYVIVSILFMLLCAAVVVCVLMQEKKSSGISSTIMGMGATKSYWDKNKGRSLEGNLEKYTKIGGAVFLLIALIFPFVH